MTLAELRTKTRAVEVLEDELDGPMLDELEARAWKLYEHGLPGPWLNQHGPRVLARLLARLDIAVLDPAAVAEYQSAVLAAGREQSVAEQLAEFRRHMNYTSGGDAIVYVHPFRGTVCTEEECRAALVESVAHRITFQSVPLSYVASDHIPDAVLDTMLAVCDGIDAAGVKAGFSVEAERFDTDPFLVVRCGLTKYYLGVWDEPAFEKGEAEAELLF